MANQSKGPELALEVCQAKLTLPQDVLEKVLSLMPRDILLKYRAVCKSWDSELIPSVIRMRRSWHPRSKAAMLFSVRKPSANQIDLRPIWYDVGNSQICSPETWQFKDKFPIGSLWVAGLEEAIRSDRDPSLFASEGGLLFFKLANCSISHKGGSLAAPEILVCNPLTGQHKTLSPPSLDPCLSHHVDDELLNVALGVVFSEKNENYKLVATQFDKRGVILYTMVYDSLACSWKQNTNVAFKFLLEDEEPEIDDDFRIKFVCERGMSYNRDLYWRLWTVSKELATEEPIEWDMTVKYDTENHILSQSRRTSWNARFFNCYKIDSDDREVLLLEDLPLTSTRRLSQSRVALDRYRPTDVEAKDLEVIMNSPDMRQRIELWLEDHYGLEDAGRSAKYFQYFGFRQNDRFYNVIYVTDSQSLKIIVDDTSDNLHPRVAFQDITFTKSDIDFEGTHSIYRDYSSNRWNFWAFFPSLTTLV